MVRHTKRRKINNKRTRKQDGAGKLGNMGSFGSLFAKRGGPPPLTTNTVKPNITPTNILPPVANGPLAKYIQMKTMGYPEGAVIKKMLTNGKNPKNLFPEYVPANTPGYGPSNTLIVKAPEGFTLDELRDLRDYVNRSEIIVRLNKLGIDPRELYPNLSGDEIVAIIEDYSKPVPVDIAPKKKTLSMKNALAAAVKGHGVVNGKKQNISFFTDYTKQEQTDLNTIDSAKIRIKEIDSLALPVAKKSIKQAEEKGQQIKDHQLRTILALLKEKRDLESTVSTLLTTKLKDKMAFVKGTVKIIYFLEDKDGPLPKGWKIKVDSEKGEASYENKYTHESILERPTQKAFPPELPEGWSMDEDDIDAWYINTLTNKTQWEVPTTPAQLFNTTGWEQTKNTDGSYSWYMPYNKNNSGEWFVMRNADKIWYENPSNGSGVKYNKPPF